MFGLGKTRLLSLSPDEASFERREFPSCDSRSREHLESILRTFIAGYNIATKSAGTDSLARELDKSFSPEFVGFAYEGAGLWFALIDLLLPRGECRLGQFVQTSATRHDYIVAVGAGFAAARVPLGSRRLSTYQGKLDPVYAWCLADGYGFHQGFFDWRRYIVHRKPAPTTFDAQQRALFDAGVGRSMWWVFGADAGQIAEAISGFPAERRAEMWTGIGTALAYAGAGSPGVGSDLLRVAGDYRLDLLSGIPFAAHMRDKGGNPASWTDESCLQCLGLPAAETSRMIASERDAYLASWEGDEQAKWAGCYLALRRRVKDRLIELVPNSARAASMEVGRT